MCTVSHISGYGWIRKACSFYAINAGKIHLSYLCLKLRKLINLYTMVISFLTLLSKLIMLIKQIVEQLCYIEFFPFNGYIRIKDTYRQTSLATCECDVLG